MTTANSPLAFVHPTVAAARAWIRQRAAGICRQRGLLSALVIAAGRVAYGPFMLIKARDRRIGD